MWNVKYHICGRSIMIIFVVSGFLIYGMLLRSCCIMFIIDLQTDFVH